MRGCSVIQAMALSLEAKIIQVSYIIINKVKNYEINKFEYIYNKVENNIISKDQQNIRKNKESGR